VQITSLEAINTLCSSVKQGGQTCRTFSSFRVPCQKDSNQVGRALKLSD